MIRAAWLRRACRDRLLKAHFAWGMLLFGAALEARAADVVAALPYTLHRGPPPGWASTEGVDWARSHRTTEAPLPGAARALWQAQVPGGVSCNLLVDEGGRVFAAGQGHVTQIGRDGAREYSHPTNLAGALAAALLADGTRVILTSDGRVSSWSRKGRARFSLELVAPRTTAHGSLLPIPDGGALATVGASLFELEASGAIRGRASLKRRIDHTLVAHDRAVIIDDAGDVMTWDGESPPEHRGNFGGQVMRVTTRGHSSLVGLFSDRGLIELSLSTGERTLLAGAEKLGLLPVLATSGKDSFGLMRADGIPFLQGSGPIPANGPSRAGNAEVMGVAHLLAGADGTLISLGSHTALRLQKNEDIQEIPEVRCPHPVSLVPAGPSRVVVACSSGQLWLIGPPASAPTSATPPALNR